MHIVHIALSNPGGFVWGLLGSLLAIAGIVIIVTGFKKSLFAGWISAVFGVPMIMFGVWIILMVSSGSLPGHGGGR